MICGIDPGYTGAIAIYDDSGSCAVIDMPVFPTKSGKTEINHHGLLDIMREYASGTVWLEQVASRPGQGVSSVFRFGQGYGAIEMACAAAGCPIRYVAPAKWKRYFGLTGVDKDAARSVAIQRVPSLASMLSRKKDVGRADAILIALYGASVGNG